jgi:hypothetical protein
MAAAALILLNSVPTPLETIKQSDLVTLSNSNDTGVTTWEWTLVSKPAGSTAALSSTTTPTCTFTADVEGAYLVRLIVNKALSDRADARAIARIKTPHASLRLLARDETVESDPVEGWASPLRSMSQLLEKGIFLPTKKTAVYVGSTVTAPVALFVTGVSTLLNGDVVPSVNVQTTEGTGSAFFGFYDAAGSLTNGSIIQVVTRGNTASFTNPASFSVGDPVYATAAGAIGKTPSSDATHLIGVCTWTATTYCRICVYPSVIRVRAVTAPLDVLVDSAASNGSDSAFARAGHSHKVTTYSSTPASLGTGAPGTSGTAPARGNHVHDHGSLAGGSFHATAISGGANGFLSGTDKAKLDGVKTYASCGVVTFGMKTGPTTGSTLYMNPGGWDDAVMTTEKFIPLPMSCNVRSWCIYAVGAGSGGTTSYTIRKNGVDVDTVIVPGGSNAGSHFGVGPFAFSAGDRLSVKVVGASITTEQSDIVVSVKLDGDN